MFVVTATHTSHSIIPAKLSLSMQFTPIYILLRFPSLIRDWDKTPQLNKYNNLTLHILITDIISLSDFNIFLDVENTTV